MPRLFHLVGEGLELSLGDAAGAVRAAGSRGGESEAGCGRSKADEIYGKDHDKDRDADEDKNERRKERNKIQAKNAKRTKTQM